MDDDAENAARNARHAEAGTEASIALKCRCPNLPGATRPGAAW